MWNSTQEKIAWLEAEIASTQALLGRMSKRAKGYKVVEKRLLDYSYSLACLTENK